MKAILLAGGAGLRLREVVPDLPKPMAPVGGRPFLEYLVMQLVRWGVKEMVLSVGYKKEAVKSYFGRGERWSVRIEYSEEDEPLGTGGALRKAAGLIREGHFITMNGDSFLDMDFKKIISYHESAGASVTMGLVRVSDVGRYGCVEVGETGEILRFIEKGKGGNGIINGGIYICNRAIIDMIPDGNVSLEKDVLPNLINKGLYGMVSNGFFIDIGIPRDYLMVCERPEKLLPVGNKAAS